MTNEGNKNNLMKFIKLSIQAVPTGFEPAISALTGPHVWPLHHGSNTLACGRDNTKTRHVCQPQNSGFQRSVESQQSSIDIVRFDPGMRHKAEAPRRAGIQNLDLVFQQALHDHFAGCFNLGR